MGILDQYLEDWQKGSQRYNRDANAYNNTLVLGTDGKPIGEKDGQYTSNAPRNFTAPYGMLAPAPKDPAFNMVRQNPISSNDTRQYFTQKTEGSGSDSDPQRTYYIYGDGSDGLQYQPTGSYGESGLDSITGMAAYDYQGETPQQLASHQVRQWENGQYGTGDITYTFPDQPAEFTKKKPTFTMAQEKQLGQPDEAQAMSDAERGGNGIIARLLERKNEQD